MTKRFSMLAFIAALIMASVLPAYAARTALTVQSKPGLYGTIGAGALALTFTAADAVNKNEFIGSGREAIIARNVGASAYTVTISSAPDELGRVKDVGPYSIPANGIAYFGPVPLRGFGQTQRKIYLEASNASIEFAVVRVR